MWNSDDSSSSQALRPGVGVMLLCERPGLPLIRIDTANDRMLVLPDRFPQALSVPDLISAIRNHS